MKPPILAPDFVSEDFHEDPYSRYVAFRRDTPVFRNGDGTTFLTRHADCERLLTDPLFRRQPPGGSGLNAFDRKQRPTTALDTMIGHWMIFMDPPRHDSVRKAFAEPFTARAVRTLEPAIDEISKRLADAWRDKPSVEIVSGFASPFPLYVLCHIVGIPPDDWRRIEGWTNGLTRAMDSGIPRLMAAALPTSLEIRDYFRTLVRDRTAHPRGDFLSDLVAAGKAGALTEDELVYGIAFLLLAGHETTKNLLGNTVLTLGRHPAEAEALRRDPALVPAAIEELLRFESPFQKLSRWPAETTTFGDYTVEAGRLATALIGSANRDESVFPDSGRFDIRRAPNRHLGFGRGAHTCLGTVLARFESRLAVEALLRALPEIEIVEHKWRPISSFRSLERLTVALH